MTTNPLGLKDLTIPLPIKQPSPNQPIKPTKGALNRFAQFFVAPLFTASATQREMHAVDSGR